MWCLSGIWIPGPSEHGKAVRQLPLRQNNTKHEAGTLPLEQERVTNWRTQFQRVMPVISCQSTILTPVRQCHPWRRGGRGCAWKVVVSKTQCARVRTTHQVVVSRAITILRCENSLPLKHAQIENINGKGRCTDCILLAFAEIAFVGKLKTGFEIAIKKDEIRDSREKKSGNAESGPLRIFSVEKSPLPSSLFPKQSFPATHKFLKG